MAAAHELAIAAIDVKAYVCVRDLDSLDAWVERATKAGVVGFDTETDAVSSANAELCGVSLAVAPGEACYIPLGHGAGTGSAWRRPAIWPRYRWRRRSRA